MVITDSDRTAWAALRNACRRRMDDENLSQTTVCQQNGNLNKGDFSWWLSGKKHSSRICRVIAAWLGDQYRPADHLIPRYCTNNTINPADDNDNESSDDDKDEIAPPNDQDGSSASDNDDATSVASTLSSILVDFSRLSTNDDGDDSGSGSAEPPASRKDRGGFVYVMESPLFGGDVAFKVGHARGSGEQREASLRTGNPDLQLVLEMYTADCVRAEHYAHALLDPWRYRRTGAGNEFFKCTRERAIMAVVQACSAVDRARLE